MIIASFCIPTYNRGPKVYNLVQNILQQSNSINFEIIVLDNCSSDNTSQLLNTINDKRFKYYINEEKIIGPINIINSLSYATGKYSFLCLDKDYIDPAYIELLIENLNSIPVLSFGHCELNIKIIENHSFFSKGFDSLYNMSYQSAHPTGMFFNTEYFKKSSFNNFIVDKDKIFGFYPDIINAEMSLFGASMILRIPIFRTETLEECEEIKSYTFKTENDLFFTPKNRFKHLIKYLTHLLNLDISKYEKITVLKQIYKNELTASTFGYKSILLNNSICKHYYIKSRHVSIIEILKITLFFTIKFILNKLPLTFFDKLSICISQNIVIFSNTLHKKMPKPHKTKEVIKQSLN